MERKTLLIPIFLILLIGIITCIGIFTNTDKKNDTPKTTTTTKKTATNDKISPVLITVVLEINPKIALELNEEEIVVNMYPLNEDAKQYTREEYIGKSLEKSIEKVVKDTKSYINKNKKITVSVIKGETSFTESKILSIKSKVVNKIKEEDKNVKVEEKELTTSEITEVIEEIKDIKEDDKLPENNTTTTTTAPTENTSTTTSSKKTTTTTKKTTTKNSTTTKKPDYNLNENIKIMISEGDIIGIYVFPNKQECKGKFPAEVTIPEGQTYDSYCENKIPSQPVVKGKGYYCSTLKDTDLAEPGVTTTKTYLCEWINDIVTSETIKTKLESVLKTKNGFSIGGGMGGADEITLDEEACKKFSLNCGRW